MNIINNNEGDGDEGNSIILSDYEKLRLERIKKNKEQLKRLGLDKYNGFMRTINNKPSPKKKKTPIATTVVVKRRRSSRFESLHTKEKKSTNSNLVMLDLRRADGIEKAITQATDNDDNRNDTDERSTMTETKRRVSIDPSEYRPLTDKDRGSLSQLMKSSKLDDNYLSKFQEFLERDRLSEQNMKNVMRQVRKLASGEGIHYSVRNDIYMAKYLSPYDEYTYSLTLFYLLILLTFLTRLLTYHNIIR